jgi:hypothetical protein
MKLFRPFTSLSFSTVVFSQNGSKLQPVAENASLRDTQKWLEKQITKFSKSTSNDTFRSESSRISAVKFEGCHLTYRLTKTIISETRKSKIFSQPNETSSSPTSQIDYITEIFLDLSKMNAENISIRSTNKDKMKTIVVKTLDGKNEIIYKNNPPPRSDEDKSSVTYKTGQKGKTQNSAVFTVQADVTEQIKKGFIKAIKLCQAKQ